MRPGLLNQQLMVDESILAWLLGGYQPDPRLETALRYTNPRLDEKDHLLTSEIWPTLADAINGQSVASFHGSDWQVQLSTARRLAVNAEMPLLVLDLAETPSNGDLALLEALRLALRDARMTEALLLIQHWDTLTAQTPGYEQAVHLLFAHPAPVIVSGEKEWYVHGVARSDAILRISFARPSYSQRIAIWSHFVDACDHEFDGGVDVKALASQFTLDSTQIADAVSSARDVAIQRGDTIHQRDLVNAARIHSSPNLAGLARKIEPRYEWTDIVLPEDQRAMLREMIQTVRGRGVVMESWGVGAKLKTSSGVTVLFAGPPGTGKTMSAEVIAGELGLDLYKIDLSVVVSKYIGETEKNLGKIFDEAQSSSAVLFFDEADSIFGKRSEVKDSHDRYANMEISYLLQRMELYDGITILATNLRANMDEAFTRRMQFIVDFPFPDVEERLHIWRTLFPAELPKTGEIDLTLLATRFKLAGGNIRNIIAGAAFLAAADGGAVSMEHLLHSTRRELQKMGRLISDVDLSF
ncbi:MAG: AAA family ATPase [Caldilineaceae bacterium]